MYVCICFGIYVYFSVCMFVFVLVYMYTFLYVCMYFSVCMFMYGNAYHGKQTKRNWRQRGFQYRRSIPHQISAIFVSHLLVSGQCDNTETQRIKGKPYSRRNLTTKAQAPSQAVHEGFVADKMSV
jgi:hypothetical protein